MFGLKKIEDQYLKYYKNNKVNDNQILFESSDRYYLSPSLFCFFKEFMEMNKTKNFDIYFAVDSIYSNQYEELSHYQVKYVDIHTSEYAKILATSKYLINSGYFPDYYTRKSNQIYLKIWEDIPIKTIQEEAKYHLDDIYANQHSLLQANYLLFPNDFTKEIIMNDYCLKKLYTGKVIVNSSLKRILESENKIIRNDLGWDNKTVMVYVPAWHDRFRFGLQESDIENLKEMFTYLDNHMSDNQEMYIDIDINILNHINFEEFNHLFLFPKNINRYQFISCADVLITDLSTQLFDFSYTGKPIVLFLYDYNFMQNIELTVDILSLSLSKVYNKEDLSELIIQENFDDSYKFNKSYTDVYLNDSLHDVRNIVEYIINNENHIEFEDYTTNNNSCLQLLYPSVLDDYQSIDTMYQIALERNVIIPVRRNHDNPDLSYYLLKNYAHKMNYVFMTGKQVKILLKDQNYHLDTYANKNILGDLKINKELMVDYYYGNIGEKYRMKNNVVTVDTNVSVVDNNIYFYFDKNYHVTKLLIVKKGSILFTRELTNEEFENNYIKENFASLIDNNIIENNSRYTIAVEILCGEKKRIAYLTDTKKLRHIQKNKIKMDKTSLYYEPITYSGIYSQNDQNDIMVLSYISKIQGYINILPVLSTKFIDKIIKGEATKYYFKKSTLYIEARLPKTNITIKEVVFTFRKDNGNNDYFMNYHVKEDKNYWLISANFDLSHLELQESVWDIKILVESFNKQSYVNLYLNFSMLTRLKNIFKLNVGHKFYCMLKKDLTLYAYETKRGKLSFNCTNLKKKQFVKNNIRRILRKRLRKLIYGTYHKLYKYVPVDDKMVIFISFHGRGYSDNPKSIYEAIKKDQRFKDFRFIWFIKDHKKKDIVIDGAQIKEYYSIPYFYYMSKAKYWVANCKLPRYLRKKDEQIYLQTWHGTPLKRLAHDIIVPEGTTFYRSGMSFNSMVNTYDVDVQRYNYMISPNKFCTDVFQDAFQIDRYRLIETGYPRNDFITNASADEIILIKKKYNLPLDKKIILYAPTWRDNSFVSQGYTFELKADFHKWKDMLPSDYIVVFKPHYLIINKYENDTSLEGFLYSIPANAEINELYVVSDMLITDYSSVFFDYAVLGRPIYFYMYDLDSYRGELRGFYLDIYTELPGKIYEDEKEMLNDIKNNFYDYSLLKQFNARFNHAQTGDCSQKVVDILINNHL